jgi:tape measure domain-containing protein
MSASIDERVVAMSFENAKFETGVAQTMVTLSKLNIALQQIGAKNSLGDLEKAASKVTLQQPMSALDKLKARFSGAGSGAAQGMGDIEKAANKVTLEQPVRALDRVRSAIGHVGVGAAESFSQIEKSSDKVVLRHMTSALDNVTAKFTVMQGAASVAIGNIASQAAQKGGAFAKGFSFGPIQQGLEEYKTNLGSIQTILANTQGQHVSGLEEVNKHLAILNKYSDQTIYNFSQMAKNIGTFTAAGVDLDKSTQSIKGIANLAALSGSSADQAATAMYQLSQAISAGRVGLQDWNSVVNAGMGGAVFQKALMRTAENMGTISKGALKIDKATGKATINGESFRNSIMAKPGEESWLTSDVLVNTLGQLTGDMTDAQLAAQGFSKSQIKAIQDQAKTAKAAATQVKTLSQVFDVAKETIGSGWSNTFKLIFGDFNESKNTFTQLSNFFNGIINKSANARNKVLGDWKKLGGRTLFIEGIKNAFHALGQILGTIKDAFRDIFPAKTGKDLFEFTKAFRDFTEKLKSSPQTLENLRRSFRGFFAALSIGFYIVKKIAGVIFDLLGIVGKGSGGFLNFTGGIGDFVVAMQKAIVKGDALGGFFKGLTNILRVPFDIIKALGSAFADLFSGLGSDQVQKAGESVKTVGDKVASLSDVFHHVVDAGKKVIETVNKIFEPFSKAVSGIGHEIAKIGTAIGNAFTGANFDHLIKVLQTTFLGGIFLTLRKGLTGTIDVTGGALDKLKGILGGVTGTLTQMQKNLHAQTLLLIASAIVALAAGLFVMSKIPGDKLAKAMGAVAVGLGQLVAALAIMGKSLEASGGVKAAFGLPLLAAAMIEMAAAVILLAGAMKIFATMSWDDINKGLFGMAGGLTAVGIGVRKIGPSITIVAPGLLVVALAMNVLGVAMKIMSSMSWEEITKGIFALAFSLRALASGMEGLGPEMLLIGPGLVIVAFGMTLLAGAVSAFGAMDLGTMVKGIAGVGASLLILGAAVSAIPPTVALQAAGLVVLAVALTGIAGAIKMMGSMDLGTLVKGITAMAAALVVLAVGLSAMTATLPGAAALLIAAAALVVLAPAMALLGNLEWGTIVKGLVAIAGVLLTLGVVGGIASAGLVALGAGMTAVSIAVVVLGAGIYLIAKALIMLGDASVQSTGILIAAITAFIAVIPKMIIEFLKGLVEVIAGIAKLAPQIVDSLVKIINSLLDVIIKATPKLQEAINALLKTFVQVINDNAVPVIQAGLHLLQAFLTGLAQRAYLLTTQGALIITRFLRALAERLPEIINQGARVVVAFLTGIGDHMPSVVAAGARIVVRFLAGIAKAIPSVVGKVVQIIVAFVKAVGDNLPAIAKAAVRLARKFLRSLSNALLGIADVAAKTIIRFMNKLAAVIEDNADDFVKAGFRIGAAVVKGVLKGMADLRQQASDAVNEAVFHNEAKLKERDIRSIQQARDRGVPRSELEGAFTEEELDAVFGPKKKPHRRGKAAASSPTDGIKSGVKKVASRSSDIEKIQPKITPVLDLTDVHKKIRGLGDITPDKPITVDISRRHAAAISQEKHASDVREARKPAAQQPTEIKFEQHNTSPEKLSEIEIYRRTRNQLAQARDRLSKLHPVG